MLDRLVYLLFFIFVGSGLFLVYQGMKGMGYIGANPFVSQNVQNQNPLPPSKVKPQIVEKKIELVDLAATAYVLEYLPPNELDYGCQYFSKAFARFTPEPGKFNNQLFVDSLNSFYTVFENRWEAYPCVLPVSQKALSVLKNTEGFSWQSESTAKVLLAILKPLSVAGHFDLIDDFYQVILPTLKMKVPAYRDYGRRIEDLLCHSLKKLGRDQQCLHLYPAFGSPNLQIYTLATRMVYDSQWDRLKIYFERMQKYKITREWVGYSDYLSGLYQYFEKKNYKGAVFDFQKSFEKRVKVLTPMETIEVTLFYLRALRKVNLLEEALTVVNQELQRLQSTITGPSYAGMALMLQKEIILHQMNKSEDLTTLQKQFQQFKSDGNFGDQYFQAFNALASKDKSFKPQFINRDLNEVKEILGSQTAPAKAQ